MNKTELFNATLFYEEVKLIGFLEHRAQIDRATAFVVKNTDAKIS